ncbi:MAG: transglycosylase domain-containing protein [Pseudomonadota bacterium]|nr:transglycosylase domain-containing protein [Pseudomonadota bacterium]
MAKPPRTPGGKKEDPGISALKQAKKNLISGRAKGPGRAPSKGRSPSKAKAGPRRPFLVALKSWTRAVVISLGVGAVLAGAIVSATMYRWALGAVDAGLAGPVWTVPGHVWSGPIEVWPGLAYTPEALAADLSAAGYARVAKAAQPGDFQAGADAVVVSGKAADGPGWTVKSGEVLVTFADGKVRSVTPQGRAMFMPAAMATIRGPDNENRNPVALDRIPKNVRSAVLAMEDARFYEHPGLDPVGISRALWVDLTHQEWKQGGSSLTQQVVKNLFLTQERTGERKLREALLSLALERRLGKDEILRLYLNEIYLGQAGGSSICGVDAAARAWFGKPIERVSLGEAATLAGVISAPNAYSPARYPEKATERRDLALDRMVEIGAIEASAAAAAKKEPLVTHVAEAGRMAPWAVDHAVEEVEASVGVGSIAREALEVSTTISPPLQRAAEAALRDGMAELVAAHPKLEGIQAALVVVRARDGAIVALVGGRNYSESLWDRGFGAKRQIGSTIKPLTMLAAFEADPTLSPATRLDDAPIERTHDGKTWTPANYDNVFVGPISIRRAIATSRNIPAVLLAEAAGLANLKKRWRALGLDEATNYPSAALGGFGATPVQLAGAYAVFASDGAYHPPWLVRAAKDPRGDLRVDAPPEQSSVRYSARATFLATSVMREVMKTGTGKSAKKYGVGTGAAGKSGTTDGNKDAWFVGVTGPYAVAVWVGFDRERTLGLTGSQAALPTWARFVAATGTSGTVAAVPSGVERADVCEQTDLPPCNDCTEIRAEYFSAGNVPENRCGVVEEAGDTLQDAFQKLGGLFGIGKKKAAAREEAEEAEAAERAREPVE